MIDQSKVAKTFEAQIRGLEQKISKLEMKQLEMEDRLYRESKLLFLQREIHKVAKEKGWWETQRQPLEIHMLVVSEIAEATEAVRMPYDRPGCYIITQGETEATKDMRRVAEPSSADFLDLCREFKPEGEAVELADAVIRIMDYFGFRGWDLGQVIQAKMIYNARRAHRHGGKRA